MIERDIAGHADHFVLTFYRNRFIHFTLRIEPPQHCSIQGSDSGDVRTHNLILVRELQQPGKSFVSLVEDNCILFRAFSRVQQLDLHLGSCAPRNGFRRATYSLAFSCEYPITVAIPMQHNM